MVATRRRRYTKRSPVSMPELDVLAPDLPLRVALAVCPGDYLHPGLASKLEEILYNVKYDDERRTHQVEPALLAWASYSNTSTFLATIGSPLFHKQRKSRDQGLC